MPSAAWMPALSATTPWKIFPSLHRWGRLRSVESISTNPECAGCRRGPGTVLLPQRDLRLRMWRRREKVRTMSGEPDSEYGACRAAYDIKKLVGTGIVRKIGGSRRYEPLPEGLRAVIAGGVARNGNPATPCRQHPTRDPLQTIQSAADRPALRKTSEPACATSLWNLVWPLKDPQLIFHRFG